VFRDFDGNDIILSSSPEKIVSISPVATEIICGLGASRYLIGIDTNSALLEGAPINAAVLQYYYMSAKEVTDLEPDMIFYSSEYSNVLTIIELQKSGYRLVRIPASGTVGTAEANIRFISSLLFREEAGSKMVEEMRYELDKIRQAAQLVGVRKKIYVEYYNEFYACGANTLLDELCDIAGFDNVYSDIDGYKTVNARSLLQKDPEIILIAGNAAVSEKKILDRKSIEKVSAVRENKIYACNVSDKTRPTQKIVDLAREIAKLLGTTN
jgi:iron complex transport system substrate-binding protein